ncbi:DNA mismatch repair protein MutS [uncultured Dokdonia sp.]|uniref:endonuclease MutS2 n=1 Tax=uncultured Dokdonia sp. TaxID=575653 RepID=UPI0026085113|nr:DNA mismatch repair protein MutS [uncultured Dokdonia sp.]
MINIHQKTLKDLEFHTVCEHVAERCVTEHGKEKALAIVPYTASKEVLFGLHQTNEYVSSRFHETVIPNHGYDPIDREIKFLDIEDSVLERGSFKKLSSISETVNIHLKFFDKYQERYPTLYNTVVNTEYTTVIKDAVNAIFDKYGELRDDASPLLQNTRRSINQVKGKINSSFASALGRYHGYGYLDDIRESVVENVRVLAVTAMHRRKVKGSIMGSSKTGSIVYIQPEATMQAQRELNNLLFEEDEEIKRILKALTNTIRPFITLLQEYQKLLSTIDVIAAKAKYAEKLNAILPTITKDREITLKDAYHPLLYLSNTAKGEKTFPQDIHLDSESRIIVISGPNAGGKSITLKTVGLLQLMLQSGMLVPVHEYSRMCLFNKILTDIGDNQSIENHLSTYSYRLKNMNYFLKKCDKYTLFLIDEFGTGSDPELGGALAETFLEVFHERESYGIITTHYANLKMMANETKEIVNANMLFDARTLEPLFKLHLGEAGSSFTFEVAQKNGIPYSLINRSKKKVERGKIRFDKSIADLQKERSKLAKTTATLKEKEQKAIQQDQKLQEVNAKVQSKLENYQELYDSNQRLIYLGQKLDTISEKFYHDKKKRELVAELMKIIQIENSKRKKQSLKQAKVQKQKEVQVQKEVEQKVAVIRKKKEESKKVAPKVEKPKPILKVGDRVRMYDGKAVGVIDLIEKGKATVDYGMFTTKVSVDQLELVQTKKKK